MADEVTRRNVIGGLGALGAMGILSKAFVSEAMASSSPGPEPFNMLELPPLPYPEDALEPIIDRETVKIHHGKHFAAYVAGLAKDLKTLEKARQTGSFENIKPLSRDIAFNASGVILHWIYFSTIGPGGGGTPKGNLGELIKRDFGSFDTFWKQFSAASKMVEASGWGALVWDPISEKLMVLQVEKHQNLTSWGCMPLLVCDVWEHAYYLKYQNRRAEYVDNFAKIIDWPKVEARFKSYCEPK
jgi:superoxide dismutase, Fe-Mn family